MIETNNDELRQELLRSPSFMSWSPGPKPPEPEPVTVGRGRPFTYQGEIFTNLIVDERHYSPADLAEVWSVNVETIRNLFRESQVY